MVNSEHEILGFKERSCGYCLLSQDLFCPKAIVTMDGIEKAAVLTQKRRGLNEDLHSEAHFGDKSRLPLQSIADSSDIKSSLSLNPDDLLTHKEMCKALGISPQTGYDWRRKKSPRYKPELAKLAIYLSGRTVRFKREDVHAFAAQRKLGVKS